MGRSLGDGNGNPLWYSCLGTPMDRRARQAPVHRVVGVGHDLAIKPLLPRRPCQTVPPTAHSLGCELPCTRESWCWSSSRETFPHLSFLIKDGITVSTISLCRVIHSLHPVPFTYYMVCVVLFPACSDLMSCLLTSN